ncbi:MAG: DNA-binding protein WhiA [Bacilli bacterium]|nr:DNA-binding protein WhiA [Bacilli bacterium]
MNDNKVSFTQFIKEELSVLEYNEQQLFCIMAGFTSNNARIVIQNKTTNIILTTENAKIAKFIYLSYQKLFGVDPRFTYSRRMQFDKKVCFNVVIEEKADEILEKLEIDIFQESIKKSYLNDDESIKCFILGTFLSTGSCNSPISSNYHLEISFSNEQLATYINKLMNKKKPISFDTKIIKRRNNFVVYLKKSDKIVDFLAYVGAHDSCLQFEEIRVERDFRNNDNRLQICENANMVRTVETAQKQIEEIKYLDKTIGLRNIPNDKMKILCYLRLENEELSMQELANLLSEEIKRNVSKSNVNHLFRAIHQMYERFYRGE